MISSSRCCALIANGIRTLAIANVSDDDVLNGYFGLVCTGSDSLLPHYVIVANFGLAYYALVGSGYYLFFDSFEILCDGSYSYHG